ncbi:related to EDE1 protein [Fusarium fujikuroi]|nr:EDE1 protein [Fusarium fujikuroi]SCN73461.1 related to EDE1 protein [Fusarium fujikuroi]SCN90946.1 related to EDE1 protein [Fusarium fujikuroi]SCV54984.1 related to EDE1 protein [Fusarium fujikuroi]
MAADEAPNLNLSPEEKRTYGQLFRQADSDSVGVVVGEIAVRFFHKTGLDSRILGEIWQIADKENRGFLTPAGFGIALRLIGHAQAGREPTPEIALQQAPLPRFDGIVPQVTGAGGIPPPPPVPVSSPPPPAALQAQSTGGPIRIPPLTPEKVAQYSGLFERQPLQGGQLPGDQARTIFEKSGLPNEALGRIWQLADTEQRGALVLTEFIIAMHLLTSMKTGALRSLPSVLPAGLYEAASRRGPASRQSSTGPGISAIPRQVSGTAQVRTSSPLGRPPMSPQQSGASDWAVTPADKARFDQIYADLDKGNKGYITGEEAVTFFSQSNLPEDSLAQIWDLADTKSQGQLSRDEFAVAMYLIRQQRSGRSVPLPTTLPPNLVPPSMRTQIRPQTATSAFDPPPPPVVQAPPPAPKSALDDLFGLESGTSSPAPPPPAQAPMSTGGSNANDPFAGGSALTPTSPVKPSLTGTGGSSFKPFVPSSSFGRGLTQQPTGGSAGSGQKLPAPSASEDLLSDNDEASKNISGETTELANLSNQISSLSKQTQDVQAKRNTTQNELNQATSQKQNFEQRLAQLRTLYEKEAQDTRALEEQLSNARKETAKLQSECMALEGTYRDTQTQHQQVLAALQADQQENTNLRERIRVVNGEIAQLKPQIEKLKSDARQQKGLVAINKKQLSTTEGERDKLKGEAEELTKSIEDLRLANTGSPASASAQIASPAASTSSANNPFFRRTASTDIMGAFASPPPTKNVSDKSFDDLFGPSFPPSASATPPPPPQTSFKPQHTGASTASAGSYSTPPAASSPIMSRQATLAAEPPAPPESRQISSSFLPFPDHTESLSSSRQVSPPASRADDPLHGSATPVPGDLKTSDSPAGVPGAFPGDELDKSNAKDVASASASDDTTREAAKNEAPKATEPGDPFSGNDEAKAKADFENAFAAFTTAKSHTKPSPEANKSSAFDSEFPPISELERDDDEESDSSSDNGGFDDNFTPASPPAKPFGEKANAGESPEATHAVPASTSPQPVQGATPPSEPKAPSTEQPSSPATVTEATAQKSSVDDIFGAAATGTAPASQQPAPSNPPQTKGGFDDLDSDFEGLEDAKEGSADEDFANISRSGLDDFNPVFDSSPPGSQTKTESTAFGNESFDFISHSSTGAAQPAVGTNQQKAPEAHDWDAIFSGLDSPSATAAQPASNEKPAGAESHPGQQALNRTLSTESEHDDPILKSLTSMGYKRPEALDALEKYDYDLDKAANFLASRS